MKFDLPVRPPSLRELRAAVKKEPLGEFFVWWQDLKPRVVAEFARVVGSATSERPVQQFLQRHPALLIRHLGGGHGRWVIPQQRLGAEHVTDFLIGDAHSFGRDWYAVELESPAAKMFNKSGDPSAALRHAVRQVHDWRNWLTENLGYARRPRTNSGLGLAGMDPQIPGYVIIGRRASVPDQAHALRRRMMRENSIEIHSYDWLLDAAGGRVDWFQTELGRRERGAGKRRRC